MVLKLTNILVKFFLLLLQILSVVANSNRKWSLCNTGLSEAAHDRIVGGTKTNIKTYPLIAAIVVKKGVVDEDSLQCGCAIIAPKWVLSAAHCVELLKSEYIRVDDIFISGGHKDWSKGHRHTVTHMVGHEKYNASTLDNDIALFHVKNPFNRRNEMAWPLASKFYPYRADTVVTVLGWGVHHPDTTVAQRTLEFAKVLLFNQRKCISLYEAEDEVVTTTQFCAGLYEGGKDACQFDSGGPLIDNNILIGIVSWGISCGEKDSPGVYTKVSVFEKWIVDKSKELRDPIVTKCKFRQRTDELVHLSNASYFCKATKLFMLQILFMFVVNILLIKNLV